MIHHYQGVRDRDEYVSRFGIDSVPLLPTPASIWPRQTGTFVRRPRADHPGSSGSLSQYEASTGRWGLIPLFSKDGEDPLFEAQAETAFEERNFYQPWKRGHRCVVLAEAIFETDSATGAVIRHSRADGKALAMAGLWNGWRSPQGQCVESFAILTVHADQDDAPERRMVALLHDAWLDDWLNCPVEETSAFLRPFEDTELVSSEAEPAHER
ncbi:SOS response-associated peptidase family protein [Variovorax sp. J22R133]|uniref:SOS response-associated peptidase family protein n=1 Tax=Variovorax brevis TaxID=3053503 RepID=UPI002578D64C|nr:SOS response-associated peptidase family protein [Variovorax sp. J22R133]MDM0115038.1 SOS response-associated peptidase family protein [Variovorax sp. J22R133]